MVRRDPPRWNGEQNHPAMQQSSLSQNFASLGLDDDSSEAAVQRWLTSPAATTRSAPKKFHRSNSSPVGPLGTGVETRTAVSSPRAATRGSRLLKERLRQRRVTVKQQMEPKGNDPSQSDDRMDFLFHQPWKKETSTTSTRSTAPFSFSEAGSFESPTSASEASLQTPPPIKNNWEEASNSSFNGGTHGRRSVRSLSIEAVSPRSSVVPPPPPPPQGARMNAKGTPSGSPIGVQTPPRRVGRASVRHQPLAGDSIVGDSSPTTQERRTKGFFGSRDRRNSSSSNSTNCNSPESRASAKLKTEKNEGLISKDYIVNKMMAKQRQDSDEEREKQDSRVKRTMQPLQQRQPLNPPSKMNWIKLHVYDLITDEAIMQLPWGCHFPIGQCFNAVNSGLHTLGTGAYHVGIEVR